MSDINNNQVDDLVAMLDGFMAKGGGHMNVDVDEAADTDKTVEEMGCIDCSKNALACSVPTLLTGMDNPEDDVE